MKRKAPPTPSGEPVGHWTLTVVLLVTCALALCLQGYARRQLGHAGTQRSVRGDAARVDLAGSVIDFSGVPVAAETHQRSVALTFDDGPDPRWTPAILDVLAKHGVVATFFVVGSRVAAHPELARSIQRAGHELGTHTFTHVDVTTLPWWQQRLQLSLTQTVMAGAVGTRPILFRPPYSSTLDALDTQDVQAYRRIAGQGYLISLTDLDSEDWRRPGVDAIVANATPLDGKGAVVLFHDAGGDRQETVDALDLLITRLQAQNYSFERVSDFAGLPAGSSAPVANDIQQWHGRILIWSLRLAGDLADGIGLLMIPLGLLAALRTVLLLAFARAHSRRPERAFFDAGYEPSVTILVPAFNEAVGIETAVRSLSTCDYPNLRVIVIDDGSTDNTAAIVTALGLGNVTLLRQRNSGKPAALNAGMRALQPGTDIVVTVDGDTVFERDAVRWLVQPFADTTVGAVSGNTKVANRAGLLGRWQHIEYVMGFNLDRRMYELLNCMPTVPGAIGAFRAAALHFVGGLSSDTLAEDTDLTMAINRSGWRVVYQERAIAWTEAPATLRQLWRQRYRWSYGTMQAMWKHRGAVLAKPPFGRRALPYMFVFQVLFPLAAPLIDLYAIYGLVFLNRGPVLGLWVVFNILQVLVGVYAFWLDHERPTVLLTMPLQQIVYRQLLYLVVIHSAVTAVLGAPLRWHKLARTGNFSAVPLDTNAAP